MTSTDHRPASHAGSGLRLTRRGRVVVVVLIIGVMLGSFWLGTLRASFAATVAGASGAADERPARYESVMVRPGETLWEIASRQDPDADPRVMLHRIADLNDLRSSDVQVGQRVLVPLSGGSFGS